MERSKNQQQIITALELKGLKVEPTLEAIKGECDKLQINFEDVNYIDVNVYRKEETPKAFIWLVNHDKTTNKYNYFNNNRAITIPVYADSELNHLKNILTLNKRRLGEHLRLVDGYYIRQAENNKPSTLQALKESYNKSFVCFAAWNGYSFKTFNIEDKKTVNFELCYMDGLGYTFNLTEANETRTKADKIFVILNDNLYIAPQIKHNSRLAKKVYNDPNKRYKISDVFGEYKPDMIRPSYTTRYNSDKSRYDYTIVHLNGYAVELRPDFNDWTKEEQQQFIYNRAFDHSGYFKLNRVEELKRRAEQRKRNNARNYWINLDKTPFINKINSLQLRLQNEFNRLLTLDLFNNERLLDHLKSLKFLSDKINLYKSDFDRFSSVKDYTEHLKAWEDKITIELILLNDRNINNTELKKYSDYKIVNSAIVNYYEWETAPTPAL